MRRTEILPRPRVPPCASGLCRLLRSPAGSRPFPALSPRIFPRVPGPLPRRSPWCIYSFLPTGHRPSPSPKWVGTPRNCPHNDVGAAVVLGATVIHSCSGPRVCSPPRSFPPQGMVPHTKGSRDFYVHAYLGSLPPRAVDMLAVRIEQLTAEGLSPSKIRGLAGRS